MACHLRLPSALMMTSQGNFKLLACKEVLLGIDPCDKRSKLILKQLLVSMCVYIYDVREQTTSSSTATAHQSLVQLVP